MNDTITLTLSREAVEVLAASIDQDEYMPLHVYLEQKLEGYEPPTATYTVTITHTGNPGDFDLLFAQYLESPENPFLGDYGPEAWGGYDGPLVLAVKVGRVDSTEQD